MKTLSHLSTIRRIKPLYSLYNFFNYQKLKYQANLYKKYGVHKSYFSSLSSTDFKEDILVDRPLFDQQDSEELLPQMPVFSGLSEDIKASILHWSANGYAVLKGFFSENEVSTINHMIDDFIRQDRLPVKDNRKLMFAVRYSDELRNIVNTPRLTTILELLLGRPVELFQSVNFLQGSEEAAHSDFIHMSTYPYGYLIAVWIALEDIDAENGNLFYYPGSHRLPYVMNSHYKHGGSRCLLGKDAKKNYVEAIERLIDEQKLQKKDFLASKGDVLIWHANLLHGGNKVIDPKRTRKSMVMHYYGSDVIRYHEITQRPSFKYSY